MSFNWRQAGAAMGGSIAQIGNTMLTAEVQRMRDEQMQKFQREEREAGQDFTLARDQQGYIAQAANTQANIQADMLRAQTEREQQLADDAAQRAHERELEGLKQTNRLGLIEFEGQHNPASTPAVSPYEETRQKEAAKRDSEIESNAQAAGSIEQPLRTIEELLTTFTTGKTQNIIAAAGEYFNTDAGAAKQILEAEIIPVLVESAAALKPVSNDELRILRQGLPGFDKDPRAVLSIIGSLRKKAARAVTDYQEMQEYVKTHGTSVGFLPTSATVMLNSGPRAQGSIDANDDPLGLFK